MASVKELVLVALFLGACGTDVAQTAVRPNEIPPFDCEPANASVDLPSDPALGGGDELSDSPLIGNTYFVGDGPGISIVARDGFRLYQNGELIAESSESLRPVFVPLTFLPGDNVVSVVVSSPDRAPALLVHVDELERAYVSDSTWKVNTAPSGDFRSPGYDDSDWDDALDHGLAVSMTDCAPPPGFAPNSAAHWIGVADAGARTAAFRLAFSIAPLGFGADTTGGESATPVVVSDVDELAMLLIDDAPAVILIPEGDFDARTPPEDRTIENACPLPCDDGSGQITYVALPDMQVCEQPTVPIQRHERHLGVASNKTLVGLGRGALVRGLWLTVGLVENVIMRNIAFYDVNPSIIEAGDGISIDAASRVWLDHLTFRWIGDGFVDVTSGSSALTLSWIHFDGRSDDACGDHHPRANELTDAEATIHHSFYDAVTGRAPLANRGLSTVHLLNNVIADNPDYGVGAACSAEILLEGNVFLNVAFPTLRRECTDDETVGKIFAIQGSNKYEASGPHRLVDADSDEPRDDVGFSPTYDYTVDDAESALHTVRDRAGAGSHWHQQFELD